MTIPAQAITTRRIAKDVLELHVGPQHPGSGHMRFVIRLDGDIMVEVDPDIGFVHRTMEKLAENREWLKAQPLFERMAILDAANVTIGYFLALEKLLDIEPPPRAKYIRTILCEISRIASHLYGFGILGIFLGHSTAYMWFFGDREVFIELAERLTGQRLTYSFFLPGGVRRDIPTGFKDDFEKAARYIEKRLKEYEAIFMNNPVIRVRVEGVGVLTKDMAVRLGVVGPNARASGVKHDIRVEEPYDAYPELDFEVPVYKEGDALARFLQRVDEIRESLKIIRQALKAMPNGPIIHERYLRMYTKVMKEVLETQGRAKIPAAMINLRPPAGEAYARAEAARGEYFYYLVSNGGTKPYRARVVSPSFRNVLLFKYLMPGYRLADFPAIYGSLDYFPPEADR